MQQQMKKKVLSQSISEIKKEGNKVWFTSDLHFLHKNVIIYCDRPTTEEEQTDWIINQMNTHIQDDDIVYHLGDFTFVGPKRKDEIVEILERLKGNWKFILGNHDNESMLREVIKGIPRHEVIGNYQEIKYNRTKFVLCHYPFKTWNASNHGSINIHGHTHGELNKRHFNYKWVESIAKSLGMDKRKPTINQIDVGIDAIEGHRPIEIDDLIELVAKNNPSKKTVNHHGRDDKSIWEKVKFWSVKEPNSSL